MARVSWIYQFQPVELQSSYVQDEEEVKVLVGKNLVGWSLAACHCGVILREELCCKVLSGEGEQYCNREALATAMLGAMRD